MTADVLAGWVCPGQLDALTVVPACPACGGAVDATAHGPACRSRACPDPFWGPQFAGRARDGAS